MQAPGCWFSFSVSLPTSVWGTALQIGDPHKGTYWLEPTLDRIYLSYPGACDHGEIPSLWLCCALAQWAFWQGDFPDEAYVTTWAPLKAGRFFLAEGRKRSQIKSRTQCALAAQEMEGREPHGKKCGRPLGAETGPQLTVRKQTGTLVLQPQRNWFHPPWLQELGRGPPSCRMRMCFAWHLNFCLRRPWEPCSATRLTQRTVQKQEGVVVSYHICGI